MTARPRVPREPMVTVSHRIPRKLRDAIDAVAAEQEVTPSDLMRDALAVVIRRHKRAVRKGGTQ